MAKSEEFPHSHVYQAPTNVALRTRMALMYSDVSKRRSEPQELLQDASETKYVRLSEALEWLEAARREAREAVVVEMETEGVVTWGDPNHRARFLE